MEGWPAVFSAPRLAADGTHYEVLLSPGAGSQAGKVWKFYPSEFADSIDETIEALKKMPPFLENAQLQDHLLNFSNFAHMWSIDDGFSEHPDRDKYRKEKPEIDTYCSTISKLKVNKMTFHGMASYVIPRDVPQLSDLSGFFAPIAKKLREEYPQMDFAAKRKFVEKIDETILDYLMKVEVALG